MVLFSLKIQRRVIYTRHTTFFSICLKRNDSQTFKRSNCKSFFFSSVYFIVTSCSNKCFFIPCDKSKTLFFMKVYRYLDVPSATMFLYSLKQMIWKKFVFYFKISAINVQHQNDNFLNQIPKRGSCISSLINFLKYF